MWLRRYDGRLNERGTFMAHNLFEESDKQEASDEQKYQSRKASDDRVKMVHAELTTEYDVLDG